MLPKLAAQKDTSGAAKPSFTTLQTCLKNALQHCACLTHMATFQQFEDDKPFTVTGLKDQLRKSAQALMALFEAVEVSKTYVRINA